MILVDSSVWIDAIKERDTKQARLFKDLIRSPEAEIYTCPTIIQEVLQGVRDDDKYQSLKSQFLAMIILTADQVQSAIGAAELYRSLRKKGVTIRKPNDCIIAWYAMQNKVKLLHSGADFELIARHTPLELV